MKTDRLLFGVAYYDEYLPYDRIETDMEMMEKAHINTIRIAESTWSTWEPKEGIFDFTHLHRMLDAAKEHGIRVIVGTPTYAIPTWLAAKYPDIIAQTHDGAGRYGHRQNMDITHPMYLKHAEIIIRRLMEEVSPYEHVIGFQLDNETKSYDTCSAYAQKQFIAYLKETFHDDLNALNHKFGLDYWSNRINAWEDFPDIRGTINGSLGAEYRKFQRKLVTDFLAWQCNIVKEYARPDQFITQNFDYDWRDYSFGLQPEVDQWEAARPLSVAGFDIYHPSAQDLTGVEISFGGAVARSIKKDNYLILETEAQGNLGWLPYPGQLRLQAFSHLASGANSVMYWHWHSIHNAIESYWKGILSHNLKENATYREVCQIGADFAKYGARLKNLQKKSDVALLLTNESLTGLQWFPIHDDLTYNDIVRWLYDALYQLNIECDVINDTDTGLFSEYAVIITPALYSASEEVITALRNYVAQGGHLLSTFKSMVSDSLLKIYADDQPHGMTDVFGMTYDQFTNAVNVSLQDVTFPGSDNAVSGSVRYWMELLRPSTAQVPAFYQHPHWKDYAAVTHNVYGKGTATYIGCYFEAHILKELLLFLCREADITIPQEQYPVIIKKGMNDLGEEIIYYFNYSDDVRHITYHGRDGVLLIKEQDITDGDVIWLDGWSVSMIAVSP
ncbi:MAG: beta-galactosidase [Bacillus sp. (in: Bacteria)]|nr:beta-galactosidase [Bacillus sp. (in: firmicutes)]MCM1425708.1 beta-galactosidase [Eubacterium sp.]